jgi:uncharacterized protein YukE
MPAHNKNLRHMAAAKAAHEQTVELQKTIDELELELAAAKAGWGYAHDAAYHKAYDEWKTSNEDHN